MKRKEKGKGKEIYLVSSSISSRTAEIKVDFG